MRTIISGYPSKAFKGDHKHPGFQATARHQLDQDTLDTPTPSTPSDTPSDVPRLGHDVIQKHDTIGRALAGAELPCNQTASAVCPKGARQTRNCILACQHGVLVVRTHMVGPQ
jgi:hypothetical protein